MAVALGIITTLAGILILSGVPELSRLGTTAGWITLSVGFVVVSVAALIMYKKKQSYTGDGVRPQEPPSSADSKKNPPSKAKYGKKNEQLNVEWIQNAPVERQGKRLLATRMIVRCNENNETELSLGISLATLPPTFGQLLKKLTYVDLSNNELTKLPDSFIKLTLLRRLNLRSNKFKQVPSIICKLPLLEGLDLSGNELEGFPPTLNQLTNLKCLDFSYNKFKGFPDMIWKIGQNCKLRIYGNPFPISEIVKMVFSNRIFITCKNNSDHGITKNGRDYVTNCFNTLLILANIFSQCGSVDPLKRRLFDRYDLSSIAVGTTNSNTRVSFNYKIFGFPFYVACGDEELLDGIFEYQKLAENYLHKTNFKIISTINNVEIHNSVDFQKKMKEGLKNYTKTFRLKTLSNLLVKMKKNCSSINSSKSFIYYIVLSGPSDDDRTCRGHGFVIEQFINTNGKIAYLLYQSYEDLYRLKILELDQYGINSFFDKIKTILNKYVWDQENSDLWETLFQQKGVSFKMSKWKTEPGKIPELDGFTIRITIGEMNPKALRNQIKVLGNNSTP